LLGPVRLAAQDAPPATGSTQSPPSAAVPLDLSDEVVRDVFVEFQRAIESSNLDHLLGTFDPDATPDYPQIRQQFAAFFRLHDNIKFRYQLLQVTADKDVAFATADLEMDAQPADDLPTEQRRTTQMRFQMKLTPKGWRLTGLKPMDFFTQ
jgi:ketosteroid isomerase-like protein